MRTPLDMITKEEQKAIEMQIFNCMDEELRGEPLATSVPYLLREWDAEKKYLFENVFDGQLILSQKVTFSKCLEQIETEIGNNWSNTLSCEGQMFWRDFRDFCQNKRRELYGKRPFWDCDLTAEEREEEINWFACEKILTDSVMASNEIREEFVINLPKEDGTFRPYKVQKGTRPIRVLSRLNKAFNFGTEEGLKDIAVWQSQFLNNKRLEGKICLSIHPLDYMTMSENNCDWTSCMNWPEDGCYRGGTIEMMNSPMVIVAYLESKDPLLMDLGWNSETNHRDWLAWNSKKWRTLIVVNEKGIFSVKGYPYQHKEMTQFVMNWIASLLKDRTFREVREFEPFHDFPINEETGLVIQPRTGRMYNDFGCCKHYTMLDNAYLETLEVGELNYCSFNYSGASECMHCGSLYRGDNLGAYFDGEGRLACRDCGAFTEELIYCECCGEGYPEEDGIWVGDSFVCQYCFETECFEDAWTYQYGFIDDSAILSIRLTDLDDAAPIEIGRCLDSNILSWIKEDARDKYEYAINTGTVVVNEGDLNSRGAHHLELTLRKKESPNGWVFF